jgi:hypothetical protein
LQVANNANAGVYANLYLAQFEGNTNRRDYVIYPQPNILSATKFYLQSSILYDTDNRFFASQNSAELVVFYSPADASSQGYTPVAGCSNASGKLSCSQGSLNSFWINNGGNNPMFKILTWGAQSDDEYYDLPQGNPSSGESPILTLNIIPLCI